MLFCCLLVLRVLRSIEAVAARLLPTPAVIINKRSIRGH
jgi:hypothetical protein